LKFFGQKYGHVTQSSEIDEITWFNLKSFKQSLTFRPISWWLEENQN